jgi:hypothetical protein
MHEARQLHLDVLAGREDEGRRAAEGYLERVLRDGLDERLRRQPDAVEQRDEGDEPAKRGAGQLLADDREGVEYREPVLVVVVLGVLGHPQYHGGGRDPHQQGGDEGVDVIDGVQEAPEDHRDGHDPLADGRPATPDVGEGVLVESLLQRVVEPRLVAPRDERIGEREQRERPGEPDEVPADDEADYREDEQDLRDQ